MAKEKVRKKKAKHKRLRLTNIFVHHQATASTSLLRKKEPLNKIHSRYTT